MSIVEKVARRRTVDPGPERAVRPLPEAAPAAPKPTAAAITLPPGVPRAVRMLVSVNNQFGLARKGLTYDVVDADEFGAVWILVGEGRLLIKRGAYVPADVEAKPSKAETLRDEAIKRDASAAAKRLTGGKAKRIDPPHAAGRIDPMASIAELPIDQLPLGLLDRHPDNRHPNAAAVDELVEALRTQGQLEAILVRRGPGGLRYQIVSGETRWLAAKQLAWPTIAAKVLDTCDDARALELLAAANAARTNLNAIEKARLIARLCQATADGGAGLTREAAAKIYGLDSGAGASNLVRLLELPPVWQERVASGELPQTFARELLSIAHAPRLLAHVEDDWRRAHKKTADEWDRENWKDREAVADFVEQVIDQETFALAKEQKRMYHGGEPSKGTAFHGEYPPLFELTDIVRAQLDVVKVKIDGREVEVATNKKRWLELQLPLVEAACAKKRKGKAAAAADADEREADKLTPAEAKAAAKLKAEQLARRIAAWRHEWLRDLLAASLPHFYAPELVDKFFTAYCMAGFGRPDPRHEIFEALHDALPKGISDDGRKIDEAYEIVTRVVDRDPREGLYALKRDALVALLRLEDRDPRQPLLPHALVDAIAAERGVDLAKAWADLQKPDGDRARFEAFLTLHNADQLAALNSAEQWGLYVDGKGKSQQVRLILAVGRTLPLPKCVAPLPAVSGRTSKRKRGR